MMSQSVVFDIAEARGRTKALIQPKEAISAPECSNWSANDRLKGCDPRRLKRPCPLLNPPINKSTLSDVTVDVLEALLEDGIVGQLSERKVREEFSTNSATKLI